MSRGVGETIEARIIRHEGMVLQPYRCPAGKLTIGVGRNIEDVGISEKEARILLLNDIASCQSDLAHWTWWARLTAEQQDALTDMRFNLGPSRFRQFKDMLAALAAGDHDAVAVAMLNSKWASQVGLRANEIAAAFAEVKRQKGQM